MKDTICFFNSCQFWGGGEKWHLDMATNLAARGYKILVITNRNSELKERLNSDESLQIESLKVTNLSFLNPFKKSRIKSIFQANAVKTVIMNLPTDLKLAGPAAKAAGVPNIIYRRGSAIPIKNRRFNRYLFNEVITKVIANSEATKRTIIENNPDLIEDKKIEVLYNGIGLKRYDEQTFSALADKPDDEIILGNAGRLTEQKGQKHLIAVAKILKEHGKKFKLLIAGEGPLEAELKAYAKELSVTGQVEFIGFVDNIKNFMETIDIFLFSSLWEGFGYALIEAMAAGRPIVAFNTSSNPELVEDGVNGCLAPLKNTEAFAEKVEKLLDDESFCTILGRKGREIVEKKFTLDRAITQLERLI